MANPLRDLWRTTRWSVKTVLDLPKLPHLRADKRNLDQILDLPGVVRHVCRKAGKDSIMANQFVAEIGGLCAVVAQKAPAIVVEIGTAQGGTFYLWSRCAAPGALLVSIDKPGEMGSVRPLNRAVYRTFGRERNLKVVTLDMDSHSPRTHRRLEQVLAGRKIDFLFIDGDHSYEGVKQDFEEYLPYVAPDGIIALHNIAWMPTDSSWIQVKRFWDEMPRRGYRTQAFVKDWGRSPGIGVVFLGKS